MESIGEKLGTARKERGLELEVIARETNIAKRYLEALENEDFSVFPGEPYLLGFLRNYSEYLGLDSVKMVSLYKNMCLQETPVPVNELFPRKKFPIIPVVAGAVALIVLISIFVAVSSSGNKENEAPAKLLVHEPVEYSLETGSVTQRFYKGDKILFTHEGEVYRLAVSAAAPAFMLETPVGIQSVQLGEVFAIDINSDSVPELTIFVQDLVRNDETKGAEVTFTVETPATATTTVADTSTTAENVPVQTVAATKKQTVIFESGYAFPFSLNATFRSYCLFRYNSDRKNREERYYHKSETLSVQSNNGIRIWMSNANAVKLSIIAGGRTQDLEVGRAGEVLVEDIKWVREEESGKFKLVVIMVD